MPLAPEIPQADNKPINDGLSLGGKYTRIAENLVPIAHRPGDAGSNDPRLMFPIRFDHLERFDFQGSALAVINTPTVILAGTINRAESIYLHDMKVITTGAPATTIIELFFANTRIWPITPNEDQTRAANGLTGLPYLGTASQSARPIVLNKIFHVSKAGALQVVVTSPAAITFHASISYSLFTGV